ncbi:MAG: hypothetical protein NC311_12000 [Muribaculaceae bacterium]|nr:hypothetical protein [Muribaculaceae bacterium]
MPEKRKRLDEVAFARAVLSEHRRKTQKRFVRALEKMFRLFRRAPRFHRKRRSLVERKEIRNRKIYEHGFAALKFIFAKKAVCKFPKTKIAPALLMRAARRMRESCLQNAFLFVYTALYRFLFERINK